MSFSKTVSVFAALASIFAAGATGYKLAQGEQPQDNTQLQQKIVELEKQVEQSQQQSVVPQTTPPPVVLPSSQPQTTPTTPQLPPPQPPVPPKPFE